MSVLFISMCADIVSSNVQGFSILLVVFPLIGNVKVEKFRINYREVKVYKTKHMKSWLKCLKLRIVISDSGIGCEIWYTSDGNISQIIIALLNTAISSLAICIYQRLGISSLIQKS